jgi:hypothetical protein
MTKETTCNSKAVPRNLTRLTCVMHDCPDEASQVDVGKARNHSGNRIMRLCKRHAKEVIAANKSAQWLRKVMAKYQ